MDGYKRWLTAVVIMFLMVACGGTSSTGSDTTTNAGASPASDATAATNTSGAASPASDGTAATNTPEAASQSGAKPTIRIGSKGFTEQLIVGEIAAALLENAGYTVERNLNLNTTNIVHQAMLNGELNLYIEYTGTGLTSVLNLPVQTDPQQVYNTVKQEYESRFKMTWLEPWGFNDTYALIMTKARADELGIKTISDLQGKADQLVLGSDQEFFDRPDGLPGLEKAYNIKFQDQKGITSGLLYQAVSESQVDVIAGFSTDGRIPALDLVVLQDDKQFFPPYFAAPVIRQDILAQSPEIEEILNQVANKINDETMAQLNLQVDQEQKEPADVAQAFLQEQGLLK